MYSNNVASVVMKWHRGFEAVNTPGSCLTSPKTICTTTFPRCSGDISADTFWVQEPVHGQLVFGDGEGVVESLHGAHADHLLPAEHVGSEVTRIKKVHYY